MDYEKPEQPNIAQETSQQNYCGSKVVTGLARDTITTRRKLSFSDRFFQPAKGNFV